MEAHELAQFIDYTLLRPGCTEEEIRGLCRTAVERSYYAVCVPPYYVAMARALLPAQGPKLATVIGFPHGMHLTETKLYEARLAFQTGADEIDVVVATAAFFSGDYAYVRAELRSLVHLTRQYGRILKVILETSLYPNPESLRHMCDLCAEAEVHFVKTSTGFVGQGARVEDVRLMRQWLPPAIQIKASGGIRNLESAWAFLSAGASRIGTSTPL
ncbi:MAG: deoxyribose-phosphate aldolase [Bacteroidia bacterium]